MPSASARTLLDARLAAGFTRCPIKDVNEDFSVPDDGAAWVVAEYPSSQEEQISIGVPGANVFRETGGMLVTLNAPRGDGLGTALAWIDEIRDLMRGRQFSGVTTYEASPAVIDDMNDNGLYFVVSTVVTYTFDRLG